MIEPHMRERTSPHDVRRRQALDRIAGEGHGRAGGDAPHVGAAVRVPGGRAQALRAPRLCVVERAAAAADRRRHRARPSRRRRGGRHRGGARPAAGGDGRAAAPGCVPAIPSQASLDDLLAAVAAFDADTLTAALWADWGRLGPIEFLQQTVRAAHRARRPGLGGGPAGNPARTLPVGAPRRRDARHQPAARPHARRAGRDLRHAARREPRARPADGSAAALRGGAARVYLGTEMPPPELAAWRANSARGRGDQRFGGRRRRGGEAAPDAAPG